MVRQVHPEARKLAQVMVKRKSDSVSTVGKVPLALFLYPHLDLAEIKPPTRVGRRKKKQSGTTANKVPTGKCVDLKAKL